MRDSILPQLPLFEGLNKFGECRLRGSALDQTTFVEVKREGEEEWKPLFIFIVLGNRLLFRMVGEHNNKVIAYNATTNSFSDVNR